MKSSWWPPVVAAVLSTLTFLLAKTSLTDDAFITLDYAKNLAVHGEWALIHGHPANTATSPLHVALLGFVTLLTRVSGAAHPVFALGLVNAGVSAVFGWAWARMRLPIFATLLGIVLVLLNPLLLSALGLEVLLIATALILLVSFADRPVWFGIIAGLAVLTRLDLAVFVVLIGAVAPALRRKPLPVLGLFLLVALPWLVFSWWYFGSAVPDTLVIKQLQQTFGGHGFFRTGLDMALHGDEISVLSFAPALFGVLALLGWLATRRRESLPFFALGLGGIAYYGVYSLLNVPPYHWYYVPPILALGMAGAGIAAYWRVPVRAVATAVMVLLVLGYAPAFARSVPWASPPFFGNWASAVDYAKVGRELGKRVGTEAVGAPGEIGTLAYFCDCAIVDGFSDPGLLGPQIRERIDRAGPITGWLLRLNYSRFDWDRRPIPLTYQMAYAPGPGPWQVYSAAKGVGHFTLMPIR
ncbi:hypothetical protein [Amycolatopsis acidicola]|uniref:hypothetical protein n=1 Tax=Amycolatopsis acidicola TaxID=2596893 RepID=UPI001FB75CF8|nr:hypothetical protein [Amycolatopsis acidicola]